MPRAIKLEEEPEPTTPIQWLNCIQFHPDELNYVSAQLHDKAPPCGGFLKAFFQSCLRADGTNYNLLRPTLRRFMQQYPADPVRLEMEERDSGTGRYANG